ncbi:MAG: flagellar basal body rod protein FlgB [candidate division Zixibacteria bacterium]|nr:flagellar basal body rod protein FlgB [candidate division Zixibacteria bacterium]
MANTIQQVVFEPMQIPKLQTVLDLASTRQTLLTENVANSETPGYRRKDIDFQSELKSAMSNNSSGTLKITNPKHLGPSRNGVNPEITRENIPDGQVSGVAIDQEMAQVARNQLEYSVAVKLVSRKFDGLRNAIRSE